MTVASLMERLKAVPVAPVAPGSTAGATKEKASISLFSLEKATSVAPVAPVAPQKMVAKNKAALPPDPSMAPLLALADRYCTAIQASEQARNDWRSDIEATAPEQRGNLAAYLRSQLPAPKPKAMPSLTPLVGVNQPKPLPKFSVHQPWNEADRAYQAHHWRCPTCKAVARSGHSERCAIGQHLYNLYEQATMAGKTTK